jgi:hypothetical protein
VRVAVTARATGGALLIDVAHDWTGLPHMLELATECIGPRLVALYGSARDHLVAPDHLDNIVTLRLPLEYGLHSREVAR